MKKIVYCCLLTTAIALYSTQPTIEDLLNLKAQRDKAYAEYLKAKTEYALIQKGNFNSDAIEHYKQLFIKTENDSQTMRLVYAQAYQRAAFGTKAHVIVKNAWNTLEPFAARLYAKRLIHTCQEHIMLHDVYDSIVDWEIAKAVRFIQQCGYDSIKNSNTHPDDAKKLWKQKWLDADKRVRETRKILDEKKYRVRDVQLMDTIWEQTGNF